MVKMYNKPPYYDEFNNVPISKEEIEKNRDKIVNVCLYRMQKFVDRRYRGVPEQDRDEIIQHLTETVMIKINEYQDDKCAFWAYIYNSIKYESANCLLKMKSPLSGVSPEMLRKAKRIIGDQKENHLSDEELMEKYGIKKKKTLSEYRRIANLVESLDEKDDSGKDMYDKLKAKHQNKDDTDFKDVPDPDIKILRNYSKEEQVIINIYHDVIRDEKTRKAWKRETQKRCREYDIPGNKVADTLKRYQNELYKEKA